ncbi:hypothetical protein K2X33_11820 [bacterium]|nr:hypothetical protein [bacterium]
MAKTLKYAEVISGGERNYQKVGKVSSESVKKHTKKDWKTWVQLLEKAGATRWTYQEIVSFLKTKYRLTPWWQQGVAMGFEIATGRRKAGQDARGKYMVTATKSLPLGGKAAWKLLLSTAGMELWLRPLSPLKVKPKTGFETVDGFFGEIRTVAVNRRVRMSWQDPLWEKPTIVELLLVAKAAKKSILVFNHTGIHDADTREALRLRWREAVDGLAELAD